MGRQGELRVRKRAFLTCTHLLPQRDREEPRGRDFFNPDMQDGQDKGWPYKSDIYLSPFSDYPTGLAGAVPQVVIDELFT